MHALHRPAYNAAFSQEIYRKQKELLTSRIGAPADFHLAETPVFLTAELERLLVDSARAIVAQLARPDLMARMKRAIPPRWDTPGMDALPSLTQVDFAVVEEKGALVPKLIELQGFPSLSAFEVYQAAAWSDVLQEIPGLPRAEWSPFFSGLTRGGFTDLLRRTVVGAHDPENVILMDLTPEKQKTYVDFLATQKMLGVDPVCPTTLEKEGRALFRRKDGRRLRVARIYNRVVFDELIKKEIVLPFDFRDEIDVEW
ncbi:MAG TPA: hypothetical protein VKF32_02910, partial [Thermoanaerobaculia bacterium]|nr:hypothetical protein [Thermoanaerobaculia bacterium]